MSFTSSPAGARICIGYTDIGTYTPNTIKGITAESPGCTLKKTGYHDVTGPLTVVNDTITTVPLVTLT